MKRISTFLLIAFTLFGCQTQKTDKSDKPTIAVSILPQEYFVKQIAGDLFDIIVMIPPGASPATYEPSPVQLASLERASIYMKIGYTGFEMAWMDKLRSVNKEMTIADLSENVNLIMEQSMHEDHDHSDEGAHHHGGIDPHIWLSPKNVSVMASNIYEVLNKEFPEHVASFTTNYERFRSELEELNKHISTELESLSSHSFFTYHPSLSYFARDYGLEQYPLELGGKTPSSAHLKRLIDLGKEESIGVVFLQMQFDQHNASVLADEIGAEIVQINPLDPKWFDQMMFITSKLKENLK